MSQSKWNDLPDWTDAENYAFLDEATPEVWAWEFLRRHPQYRTDWDYYAKVVKKAKSVAGADWQDSKWSWHYSPPKLNEAETYTRWRARAILSGQHPTRERIHEYMPKKWGLKHMAPYHLSYGKYIRFHEENFTYPRLIRDEDKFFLLTEESGTQPESTEPYVNAVRPEMAVVVFDLSAPLGPQQKRLATLLKQHYAEMKKYKKIQRTKVPKQTNTEHLVRHLRVLDAMQTTPDISNADMARALGVEDYTQIGNGEVGCKTASQQGGRWLEQAEAARDSYLNFLIKPSSTIKKVKNGG